jgi:hypothetical protein
VFDKIGVRFGGELGHGSAVSLQNWYEVLLDITFGSKAAHGTVL